MKSELHLDWGKEAVHYISEVCMRFVQIVFFLLLPGVIGAHAQPVSATPSPYFKRTLTVSFGTGTPLSRQSITSFWSTGPGGSLKFMLQVSKPVSVGIGAEAALLRFSESAFAARYPSVVLKSTDILMTGVFLSAKTSLLPSMRLAPYVSASVGATRLSEAVYTTTIDSVRVSYYNLPATTRLTVGVSVGTDIYVAQSISFDVEAKLNYILHHREIGASSYLRGGLRFTL
jgi:hypothetical protein